MFLTSQSRDFPFRFVSSHFVSQSTISHNAHITLVAAISVGLFPQPRTFNRLLVFHKYGRYIHKWKICIKFTLHKEAYLLWFDWPATLMVTWWKKRQNISQEKYQIALYTLPTVNNIIERIQLTFDLYFHVVQNGRVNNSSPFGCAVLMRLANVEFCKRCWRYGVSFSLSVNDLTSSIWHLIVEFLFKLTKDDHTYLYFPENCGYGDNISYQYLSWLGHNWY